MTEDDKSVRKGHSRAGIVSCILALVPGALLFFAWSGVAVPYSFDGYFALAFPVSAIAGLIFGIVGVAQTGRIRVMATVGFLLNGLYLLAMVVLPVFLMRHSHGVSPRVSCINNLRMIDGAKDQYALEYGAEEGVQLAPSQVGIYIKDMNKCFCPLLKGTNRTFESSYSINALTNPPTCIVGSNKNHALAYGGR